VVYAHQGEIAGVYPLLTVRQVDEGRVIRHYASNSPSTVFAEAYERLLTNLLLRPEGEAD